MKNKSVCFGEYSIIYYTSRKNENFEIVVDNDVVERLKDDGHSVYCHWYKNSNAFYADITKYLGKDEFGKPKYKQLFLHKYIMGDAEDIIVDHISTKTLDNRRKNLRVISKENNCKNRKGKNSNNTSGYRNVTRMGKWWRIQLQINGKNKLFSEKFEDVNKAGEFALKMRQEYYGDFSGLS